jgi:hypothetical protein
VEETIAVCALRICDRKSWVRLRSSRNTNLAAKNRLGSQTLGAGFFLPSLTMAGCSRRVFPAVSYEGKMLGFFQDATRPGLGIE